jgi:uncharacterized membrane protein YuzA (DUF378 family)
MCNGKCGGGCVWSKFRNILLIIGGLNWGLVGVGMLAGSDLNVIHMILGSWPTVEGIVYIIVGLEAVLKIFGYRCRCNKCKEACTSCQAGSMDKPM